MRLPAEHPREALAADAALLDEVQPGGLWLRRWYIPASPAVVLGLGLRHRLHDVVDLARCAATGVEVLDRQAGGGAVLVDENMLCGAICVPLPSSLIADDLTASYRWLGDQLAAGLNALGVTSARRVEVAQARADVQSLKSRDDQQARLLLTTCYGALSPHEVVVGSEGAKLVGLAQVRRRDAVLFQFGILLRDQSPLVDFLKVKDEPIRELLRNALQQRTVGLAALLDPLPDYLTLTKTVLPRSASGAAWEASDARPSSP